MRAAIRTYTRNEITPDWQSDLSKRAQLPEDMPVLVDTARTRVSDNGVVLTSATVGKKLSGGLKPSVNWAGYEFGGDHAKRLSYARTTRKGKEQWINGRHTQRQLAMRTRNGRVVYPTAHKEIPRYASLWVQTVKRTFFELWERATS